MGRRRTAQTFIASFLFCACVVSGCGGDDTAGIATDAGPDGPVVEGGIDVGTDSPLQNDTGTDARLDGGSAGDADASAADAPAEADASQGPVLWSRGFGDATDQYGIGIAIDPTGNIYFAGEFQGTINLGSGTLTSAGGFDLFVAKYDRGGNILWAKRFGDAADQAGSRFAFDPSGNPVFTGYFSGAVDFGGGVLTSVDQEDAFVAKLDATTGNQIWAKAFGGPGRQIGEAIATDSNGDFTTVGYFFTSIDLGGGAIASAGGADVYVARLAGATGNLVWAKVFGDAGDQYGFNIALDASNNASITGYFLGGIDFGGGVLTSAGASDAFVAKLGGAAGAHMWSRRFGDSADQHGGSVAVDANGATLLIGSFQGVIDFGGTVGLAASAGGYDIFATKLDGTTGASAWGVRFGDTTDQFGTALIPAGAGQLFLGGNFNGSVTFGQTLTSVGGVDVVVAKLDATNGTALSAQQGAGPGDQNLVGLAAGPSGSAIICGYFAQSILFGTQPVVTSAGGLDAFFARLAF